MERKYKVKPVNLINSLMIPVTGILFNSCAGIQNEDKLPRPNVVMILSDDQGWGDLGLNGNKNLQTPNIDKLARDGVVFDHFYVCPVSSPTRAELLTGRYHNRCGVYSTSSGGERLNTDETTIAEVFKRAGYSTAIFGKWHNGMQYPYHPLARGFDEFYGFCSGHWGDYFSPQLLEYNDKIVQGNGYLPDDLTERAMTYIENNRERPFFLYLPYNTPHSPMQVPDLWWDKFKDKKIDMLADDPEKENINFTRAALAMCENIDWNVGRILDQLKKSDLEKNTIVIYFSDNGPAEWRWNGGMKGIKGSTDEGGVRSPLFLRWPGTIDPGSRIEEITGVIDLLPTLAELAGIECKTQYSLDGISLKSLLFTKNPELGNRSLISSWNGKLSVRSKNYLLDSQKKLFNLKTDPGQLEDLSEQMPDVTQELKSVAEQFRNEILSDIQPDNRRFPVGHPDFSYTQLPARDGEFTGSIKRSNQFPNSSFLTNWTTTKDRIKWNVEVLSEGDYEAEIYYTCPKQDKGSVFQLSFGKDKLIAKIIEPHDPPLRGMENDRVVRKESYVKDFKSLTIGTIHLEKGVGELTLEAIEIPGSKVMDIRSIMLKKLIPH